MASNRNPKILERLELSQRLADQDVENNRRYWAEQAARQKAPAAASDSKPKSTNTAFTRSGADRDTYDSRVRSNYYARQNAFSQRSGAGRTQVRQNQAREEQRRTLEQERTELTQQLRAARRGNTGLNAFRREGGGERYIQRLQTRLEEVERALEERSAVPEYRLPPIGGDLSGEDLAAYLTDPRFRAETERTAGLFSGNTQAENLAYLSQQEEDALAKLAREMAYDELEAEYEALSRPLNQRRQAEESEATRRSAGEHPFLGTLYSALTSPRAAQAYTDTLWRVATGRSDTVDPNSEAFRWARASADSAQGVAEAGTRMPVLGGIEVDGQNLGSFVAETGVSIAQNLARLPMGAVGALISMGGSAAGARTVEALDQGLSPEQAAASATAAGVIEAATEKIGLDRLFRVAGTAGRDGVRELVKNALKQAGVEGTEEVVSNVANQIAEIATLGEDSAYGRRVAELTGQGMDRAEAQRQAAWELFGAESLWSFAGGALSGGVMGAGADVLGRIRGRAPAQESRDPQAGAVEALARAMAEEQAAAEPPNMPEPSVEPAPPQAAPQTDTRALNPAIRTRAGEVLNEGVFTGRYAPAFEASGLSYSEIESALTALSRGEETGENTAAETVARILAEDAPSPQASDPVEALAQAMAAETAEQARARSEEVRARNRRQVEENADVFGARGREALTANYDGEAVPADYYGGFAAAYHAGLTGADPGRERRGYGARLTGAQRQAAYEAGRADAAASLEEQQRAAAFAPTAGTESGLVYDAYVQEAVERAQTAQSGENSGNPALTAETAEKINTVAKALGVRVRFAGQVRGGTANSSLQGSEVRIEKDNPNPVLFLLGHEWTHRLQELAPGEYRKFRDFAAGELQMETQVILDAYRAAGEALSYEGALDEAAANYAGRMIEDGAVLDAFIERHRTDRTLLEKVRDAIRTLVRKLTGAERRQAKTAEGRLTKALEAAARQAGANTRAQTNAAQRGGAGAGPRFSLGQEEGVARPGQEGYTESEAETPGEEGRPYERELHAESAEQFRRRMDQADETVSERASGGYRIGGRLLDFGRSEEGQPVSRYQSAQRAQRELSALGIDSQVYAGAVEINRDGETLRMEVPESTTLFRDLVLIQAELSTDPVETAGHEAFHMWARTEAGKRYQDQLLDEVKWSSPILREKMQWLEEHYGESHIMEELAAYLSGEFHAGNNEAELRQILLDYDAVKAAWEALVEENRGGGRDTMGTWRNSLKEEQEHGRREETEAEFVRRAVSSGYQIFEGRNGQYGYRPVQGQSAQENAGQVQKEVNELGIPAEIIEGAVLYHSAGVTVEREVPQAVTVEKERILIQRTATVSPRNVAGHEAFHLWGGTSAAARGAYIDVVEENLDFASPEFLTYQSAIAQAYLGEEADLSDAGQRKRLAEELYAYLSGDIHEGTNEAELRPMFRDYDAVKAAWEALVEKEVAGHGAGQLHPEERGQAMQQMQAPAGENGELQTIPGLDTGRGADRRRVSGLRTERGDEVERTSLKGTAIDRELNEQIQQMVQEAQESGKSEAEVQADVRALVQASYEQMLQTYGSIPAGERPAREVRVPRKTGEKRKVSQTVRTVLEAQATPEAAVPKLEELAARGVFSYEAYGDRQAIEDAEGMIRDKGYATALSDWTNRVRRGEVSKTNTAEGWALYNEAANSGDVKSAMTILTNMVEHQRSAAQAVQATRILKQLSPDAQLYGAARSVRNLQEELTRKYGRNAPDLKIDEELAGRFLAAKTQKARDEAMQELYRDIGRQMPSRFVDKWNAWRYLAMLGNPRTHVRNVAGNLFFMPVVAAKDATATAIEAAAARVSGGRMGRSKGLVGLGKQGRALLSAAWADFANVEEQILGSGKYSDSANANRYIQEGRVIFRNKALEAARRGNSAALDLEDTWFSKPHYAYALAQYAKANGLTPGRLRSGKGLDAARAYAIREARKATYRDTNAFSQMISGLGRYQGSNPAKKAASVVLEGILPFRKTPANILVRGVEYSPLGLLKSLTYDLVQVRAGEMTAAEAIDGIAAGLTGTGLMALGVLLAAEGLVRGSGGGDDDENQYEELMGHQAYSLEVGGKSYTLDWLAPEALPFFVGVNLWEQSGAEHEAPTLSTMINAIGNVTEPLLEMSCLQSLNEVFDAVGYATSEGLGALPSALASAATSYLTQAVPTILGQAERTSQGERMTTYTEKNAFLTQDMQYTLGSVSGRVPGWDYQQIPYIDAWGRTEPTGGPLERAVDNFLNPGYRSAIQESAVEQALQELYEQTGEASVLPSRAGKYFTVDGERKDLTAEEYVEYATARGQTAYVLMDELFQRTEGTGLSDEDLVNAVEQVYEYANAQAKTQVSDYEPDGWVKKAMEGREAGVGTVDYILYRLACEIANDQNQDPEKRNQSIDQEEAREAAAMVPGLSDAARAYLWQSTNKQWKEKNNPWKGGK